MSKQLKSDTEALDTYFASWEPIDVRPQTPSKLPTASSRVSSSIRSTRGLYLEQLEAREVPSATVFGDASNNWDSALVWTPPSGSPETVDVRLAPHSSGVVTDHANVILGEGMAVNVSTGTGAGMVLKSDALTPLDDAYNHLHGTAANPLGTDHMNFTFSSRLTGVTAIYLKQLDPGHIAHGNVLIDGPAGRTTVGIPADGVIAWNPSVAIDSIMVINAHEENELNPLGLSGIDVRMYMPNTTADIGALTTQVAALTTQVADAQTALTDAQNTTPAAPALNTLPWPEGVNASARVLGKLNVHPGQNLYAAHFSPDGTMFVTAAQDRTAKIWNAQSGALVRTLTGNNSLVIDAVWAKDGQSIWTSGYDKHVRQYSVSNGDLLWDSGELPSLALSAAMSADGGTLLVDLHGASPVTIGTQNKQINNLGDGFDWADQVAAVNDGTMLIGDGNGPTVINPATRAVLVRLNGLGNAASAVAASPDGQWIFAGGDSGALAVWNRTTSQKIALPGQPGAVTSIAVSQDGNHLFVGAGSQIAAYDLRPLANNQVPTLLNTYTGIGNGPRSISVIGKNVTFVSGDGGSSRVVDLDRSGLSGYVAPNAAVNEAQARLTALQNSLSSSTAQLQLAQAQEAGHDAIIEVLGRLLVQTQHVEAQPLQITAQQNRVDAQMTLQTVGGNVRLSSWQGVRTSLPDLQRSEDGSIVFTGSAATLDLAQASHLVTSVSFVVITSTGHDATVQFLRGDRVIATQTVHSGDTVAQTDAQGITGVVVVNEEQPLSEQAQDFLAYFNSRDGQFQANRYAWEWWNANGYKSFPQFGGASLAYFAQAAHSIVPDTQKWDILREAASGRHYATLQLGDIDVQGNMGQTQAAAPHALQDTPTGLLLNAPDWRQNDDTLRRGASPGYLAVGRFSPTAVGIVRDPTKYSVVNLTNVSGGAHPVSVRYHTPGGDTQLGQEYYQILGNSVVLMPGAPSQIVITLNSGDIYQDPGNVDIGHIQSDTLEDILPPEAMTIHTDILAIRNTGPSEGVTNAITEISDTGRAITPGSGNALVNVWNSGRTGGTVRIITNEGTPQAHEMSFSLAAQSGKSVSINFTTPANGVLSITTILPDGRRVVDGKTLRLQGDTSEKRVATRNPDGTWTLEWKASTYTGPSVVDGGIMDNNFVLWKQQRIANGDLSVADPANYQRALLTYLEEGEAQNIAYGLGGQPTEQPSNAAMQEALSWYNPAISVAGGLDQMIDAQGIAGHIVLGLLQKLRTENTSAREAMAMKAEAILGIPATQLLAVDIQGTADAYARGMERVLAKTGFSFLLSGETLASSHGLRVETDTKAYAGGMMRIRWDVANGNKQIDHMGVYVIDDVTGKTLHNLPLSGELRNRFFLDFPINPIAKLGSPRVLIKVVAWFKDAQGNPTSEDRVYDMTEWILVREGNNTINQYLDLSALPENEPNRDVENLILSQLATNAPISLAAGNWYVEMGSGAHDNDGFHALDINLSTNSDRDKEVLAVAHGTISQLDLTFGTLTIDHDEQGDMPEWQSVYLHLPLYETGQTTPDGKKIYIVKKQDGSTYSNLSLWEGKEVNAGDVVGIIAGRGKSSSGNMADEDGEAISDTAYSSHLHYEAHVNGQAINMAKLIQDQEVGWKMEVYGNNVQGNRTEIRFVDTNTISTPGINGAWVDTTNNLIFYRSNLTTENANTDYFLAWEQGKSITEMAKVVQIVVQNVRKPDGTIGSAELWIKASDLVNPVQYWNSDLREFIEIPR